MTSAILPSTAVLLPGTGSDEVFVRAVFAGPLATLGLGLLTPAPPPGSALAGGYLTILDDLAAEHGTLLVGGISFGAHLAAEWAVRNPGRCAGLMAALPAWNGHPGQAPASLAARLSSDLVTRSGTEAALAASTAGVPPWLATELTRAWRRQGDGLAASLRAAAERPAPELSHLHALKVPAGIGACTDDPIHPPEVARQWAKALPHAALGETTLTDLGRDRESLGRATVLAWLRAHTTHRP
ncbi:alpha/beta fold hydrolase [Amycolatopsis sp. H20-H5]|uniref:alpha/beta fold hydrolase n=1 Tax=Amycolatopsis sp. H20-H5 TaxID=3046309 RepID=UPI002DBA7674|nr:alpha/beta hydrolase [Amycolatopsis sp. H20-H5]MEC3980252.1 alpha/beta hydrolase [Amycolatopsis sp. H20-H5]